MLQKQGLTEEEIKRTIDDFVSVRNRSIIEDPFFGSLALRLDLRIVGPEDIEAIQIAATDSFYIYLNPKGWLPLEPWEKVFVMKHEILHCVLRHPSRITERHPYLWNVACIVGSTRVTMSDGSLKRIVDIKPGEYIKSPHGPSRVLGVVDSGVRKIVELSVDNTSQLLCTEDHRLFTHKGLLHAKQITDATQGWVLREQGEDPVCARQLPEREHARAFAGNRGFLWSGIRASSQAQLARQARKTQPQESKPCASIVAYRNAVGVYGGAGGRRGCDHDPKTREVLSVHGVGHEHLVSSVRIPNRPWVLGDHPQEQQRSALLAPVYFRLPDGRVVAWDAALLGHQKGTREAVAALHRHTENAGISRQADIRDVGNLAENQGAERARLQVREGAGRARTYDLITEHHAYYAEGVLVHNCDYVVNGIIANSARKDGTRKDGTRVRIMKDAIQPRDEFRGKDADTVYQMLAKDISKSLLESPLCKDSSRSSSSPGERSNKRPKKRGKRSDASPMDDFDNESQDANAQFSETDGSEYSYIPGMSSSMAAEYAEHFKASPHGYMQPMKTDIDGNPLSQEEIVSRTQQCEQEWRAAVNQAMYVATMRGKVPAGISEIIEREQNPVLPWERLLQQWVTSRARGGYNWSSPSRRLISQGIYLPGRIKRALKKIAIAVDTSGSVSTKLLAKFLAEISGVLGAYPCDLDLVGIDAEVGYIGRFKNSYDFPTSVPINGRGGTNFIPFFEWMREVYGETGELGDMPEVVVYLTDGMGAYPKEPIEGVQTLWVISVNHAKNSPFYPPFGDVIVAFDDPAEGL